jgi:hypothetical protein
MSITKEEQAVFVAAMMMNRRKLNRLKAKLATAEKRAAEVKRLFDEVEIKVFSDMKAARLVDPDATCALDLGDEEFELWQSQTLTIKIARGYVDADGTYKPGFNGSMMVREAESAIIDFIMSIVPAKLGRDLIAGLDSWKWREKMIKIAKAA